jgi:O-antigen/teichoic acid export membrane protein
MIEQRPIRAAGTAMLWQAFQMGGVKAIYLVRTLVLARLLLPDDFGLIAIATTAMGFLFNITNFGMVPALVQGKNMDEANYDAAWTVDFCRSFLLAILTVAAAPLIADMFAEPRAVPIIQVLAMRPFIEAMTSIKVAAFNRNLKFRPLAVLYIIEAVVNTTLSISFAKTWGVWALVAGAIAGATSIVMTSYVLAPYRPRLLFNREAIKPLIHFGRWIFATNLIVLTGSYLLRIVISRQFGSAGLGIYVLATQLAFLPGDVAGEAVGAVAFPLFARLQNDVQQATRVFRALFSGLAAGLYPICALIMVLAPSLAQDILGPNWAGTEDVIRILALVVMIGIFGEAAVSVFKGFGQPYRITLLEVIQSSVTIAFVWILTKRFGLAGAALAWLPTISFSQLLSALFLQKILDHPFQGLGRPFLAVIVATGLCITTAVITKSLIPGVIGFTTAIAVGILSAGVSLWMADRLYGLGFARNLASVFPQIAVFVGFPSMENE